MKKFSQNLLDLFKAMLNHDAGLTTTECNGALSNNLLTRCVRKVLASSLNFPSWETLTKSFDHSSLSFALAANPRSRSLFGIWFDVLLMWMFIREDPILAATITVGLMKNLRSADSGDFKLKYKNSNIGLSDFKTDLGCFFPKIDPFYYVRQNQNCTISYCHTFNTSGRTKCHRKGCATS